MTPRVSKVQFRPAAGAQRDEGIVAWVSFVVDRGVIVDGVAIRRTLAGELVVIWPGHRDVRGKIHHHVRPVDDGTRQEIDAELIERLGPWLRGGAA